MTITLKRDKCNPQGQMQLWMYDIVTTQVTEGTTLSFLMYLSFLNLRLTFEMTLTISRDKSNSQGQMKLLMYLSFFFNLRLTFEMTSTISRDKSNSQGQMKF